MCRHFTMESAVGMFDTIRCEYPLPNPEYQKLEFQSKDLDCLLDTYIITAAGRLVREPRSGGAVGPVEVPHHGDIRFYDVVPDDDKRFVEYVARFTYGRLDWIRALDDAADVDEGSPGAEEADVRPGRWPAIAPGLEGRRLTAEEFGLHAPEKLELLDGAIAEAESLLWLGLTNLGLRRAALLVGPALWRRAVDESE